MRRGGLNQALPRLLSREREKEACCPAPSAVSNPRCVKDRVLAAHTRAPQRLEYSHCRPAPRTPSRVPLPCRVPSAAPPRPLAPPHARCGSAVGFRQGFTVGSALRRRHGRALLPRHVLTRGRCVEETKTILATAATAAAAAAAATAAA
eukprot:364531-Chlamydomonas_euryale.AAC.2